MTTKSTSTVTISFLSRTGKASIQIKASDLKVALEIQVKSGADLSGADLSGADLSRAYLSGANLSRADLSRAYLSGAYLSRADLSRAYLSGADLSGADLSGADLSRADLSGADLSGAYLRGAYLRGAIVEGARKLIGTRPILQIGLLGSRCAYLLAYLTDQGICIRAGCFFGTLEEFRSAVSKTHGTNDHRREYMAAITMIEEFAKIWTPREE